MQKVLLSLPDGEMVDPMQRASDIAIVKRVARKAVPSDKFLDAVVSIRQNPNDAEAAYLARQLIQATLPHSKPRGDPPMWKRTNGDLTLSIVPGVDRQTGKSFGYPYGSLPRLLLFWMVTQAVKTRRRRLELGHSLAQFMRDVGLDPATGGGKRGDARRLRDQMERLFRAIISFEVNTYRPDGRGKSWLDMQIAPVGELWWDPKRPDQGVLWGNWIELGERFFQAITASPVPVDLRALKALKGSPLKLDLYALAVYKAYVANKKGAQFIPWEGLLHQLGANYDAKRIDHFKDKVKAKLCEVSESFPEGLKYDWHRSGLTFRPGTKLPIAPALAER